MRTAAQLALAAIVGAACVLLGFELNHPAPHHYRFETRGIQGEKQYSLWRFDEMTGDACQLQSDEADGWIGGHCQSTR